MPDKNRVKLGERFGESEIKMPSKNKIHYPTIHIRNKNLPLQNKDINKEIIAVARIRPTRISKTIENGKEASDYVLEVLEINVKPGRIPHYATQ